MRKPAHALLVASTIALAFPVTGCALGKPRGNGFAKIDKGNIGVALRAQAAMEKGDTASAVQFAERAVENSPTDAGFRALLGNVYLAAGRFRSAEAAFADALAIYPDQVGVPLKLALTQAAQGKSDATSATLEAYRDRIDAADSGLALALAGRPGAAIEMLDLAARSPGADSRVRQNLALAHALAGDWVRARAVAAQDVPGDQLETRMSEWAALARPSSPASQVAALIGVTAATEDAGVPVRLALNAGPTSVRMAMVEGAASAVSIPLAASVAAAPVEQPPAEQAPASPAPVEPAFVAPQAEPMPAVVPVEAAPAVVDVSAPDVADMVDALRRERIQASGALPRVAELRRSAERRYGKSKAVVQLGAYASQAGVQAGWNSVSRRHRALQAYVPASARFDGPRGTVYRLSLKGFASDREARGLCMQLKASGAACFVRNLAGDSAVRFAGR